MEQTAALRLAAKRRAYGIHHHAIRILFQDVCELNFGNERKAWPRWLAVAYVNGLQLGHYRPDLATELLRDCGASDASQLQAALHAELDHPMRDSTKPLNHLRDACAKVLRSHDANEGTGRAPHLRRPKRELARWFAALLQCGLLAGLRGESLFAGQMLRGILPMQAEQKYLAERLVYILRRGDQRRRPLQIEIFVHSLQLDPIERRSLTAIANRIWTQIRQRRADTLREEEWVARGFREGLALARRRGAFARRLIEARSPVFRHVIVRHFTDYIGFDRKLWIKDNLAYAAQRWLARTVDGLNEKDHVIIQIARIRHLLEFAFWMGLYAGSGSACADLWRQRVVSGTMGRKERFEAFKERIIEQFRQQGMLDEGEADQDRKQQLIKRAKIKLDEELAQVARRLKQEGNEA